MTFTTFSGEKKDFNKIDHQHLSNIYWFNKIINERDETFLHLIIMRFRNEFNGKILPYRPHPNFKEEIESLDMMGILLWQNDEKSWAKIQWEGKEVGEYKSTSFIREEKLNMIFNKS